MKQRCLITTGCFTGSHRAMGPIYSRIGDPTAVSNEIEIGGNTLEVCT